MTRKKDGHKTITWVTPSCSTGKRGYLSRKEAKAALKQFSERAGRTDQTMSAYRCRECDYFHLGHLPGYVKSGELGRPIH